MNATEEVTITQLLDQIKTEHQNDSSGACVTCSTRVRRMGRQSWPCVTLRLVQQLEALMGEL